MENVEIAGKRNFSADRERIMAAVYRLFWIYVVCGVAGFAIETIWCWIDFQKFTSRTSNLFFPISCVWGAGGIVLHLLTRKNRWNITPSYRSGDTVYIKSIR